VRRQRADQATDVGGRACGISRHLDFPPFQDGRKNRHEIRAPICPAGRRADTAPLLFGRMYNADILDLYGRVGFGTPVVVAR
jgi:hypothetical protein